MDELEILKELPRFEDVVTRFGLYRTDGLCNPQVTPEGVVSCTCLHCLCWHSYAEGRLPEGTFVQYEVLTQEFVQGLAGYLRVRAAAYVLSHVKVLEVGAGDGRLSHYLQLLLRSGSEHQDQVPTFEVIATDNGQRGLATGQPYGHEVKTQAAVDAIRMERPHIVISCWQPLGVDWTAEMRATDSVLEYLLIGEKEGGICGHPWLTWGFGDSNREPQEDMEFGGAASNGGSEESREREAYETPLHSKSGSPGSVEEGEKPPSARSEITSLRSGLRGDSNIPSSRDECQPHKDPTVTIGRKRGRHKSYMCPPYVKDGFERVEISAVSDHQIGRTDERWSSERRSRLVSFRREYRLDWSDHPACDFHANSHLSFKV